MPQRRARGVRGTKRISSSQAIIREQIKDLVPHANNLNNSWLVRGENTSGKVWDFSSEPTVQLGGCSSSHAQGWRGETEAPLCWTRLTGEAASATSSNGLCSTGTQINDVQLDPQEHKRPEHQVCTYWRTSLCSRLYFPPFFMAALCTASMARSIDCRTTSCSST